MLMWKPIDTADLSLWEFEDSALSPSQWDQDLSLIHELTLWNLFPVVECWNARGGILAWPQLHMLSFDSLGVLSLLNVDRVRVDRGGKEAGEGMRGWRGN